MCSFTPSSPHPPLPPPKKKEKTTEFKAPALKSTEQYLLKIKQVLNLEMVNQRSSTQSYFTFIPF